MLVSSYIGKKMERTSHVTIKLYIEPERRRLLRLYIIPPEMEMKLIIPAICNLVIIHYPVSFRQRFSGGFGVLFMFISQASFFGIPRAEGESGVSGRSPPDFQERDEQKIRRMEG